jgi:hypothetical protein
MLCCCTGFVPSGTSIAPVTFFGSGFGGGGAAICTGGNV